MVIASLPRDLGTKKPRMRRGFGALTILSTIQPFNGSTTQGYNCFTSDLATAGASNWVRASSAARAPISAS